MNYRAVLQLLRLVFAFSAVVGAAYMLFTAALQKIDLGQDVKASILAVVGVAVAFLWKPSSSRELSGPKPLPTEKK